ncbi:MAG TPA: hypothetical protein VGZ02_11340 [Candidatus Baltobacteraceae bacterium]|jgi:hypothetical protein|nr:hypothetical protein [Candidatus Baltobacteraceae bacterium]
MNPTDRAKRQYMVRFVIAMIAYIAIIIPVSTAAAHTSGALRIALAMTPLIPIAVLFISAVVMIRSVDELERQIHIEALAISAGLTALLALTYGLLEVAGFPHPSAWITYCVLMFTWGITVPFVSRRYKG